MRVLIKLVIVVLVLHATYRVGAAYMAYYKFEDALRNVALFGQGQSEQELRDRALQVASTLQIPVKREQIAVRRDPAHTYIDASYTTDIEILPTYRYPWEFKASVETLIVSAPR